MQPLILTLLLIFIQPPSLPTAREVLALAARIQLPGGAAFQVRGFEARLKLRLFTRDKGSSRARTNEGEVLWRWHRTTHNGKTRESYLRRTRQPDGKEVWVAFTGTRYLLKEKGHATLALTGESYQKDREQIQAERHQVSQLLELLFLKDLLQKEARVSFGRRALQIPTQKSPANPDGKVSVDEIFWQRKGKPSLTLYIGRRDHDLYRIVKKPSGPKGKQQELRFSFHRYRLPRNAGENFQRILIPRRIRFFKNGKLTMETTANDEQAIVFNPGLGRRDFRPPHKP